METNLQSMPADCLVTLAQIIGRSEVTLEEAEQNRLEAAEEIKRGEKPNRRPKRARPAIEPLIPVSKTTWWDGIRSGRFPPPVRINGGRRDFWHSAVIRELIERSR